jgi:hypothetical protein
MIRVSQRAQGEIIHERAPAVDDVDRPKAPTSPPLSLRQRAMEQATLPDLDSRIRESPETAPSQPSLGRASSSQPLRQVAAPVLRVTISRRSLPPPRPPGMRSMTWIFVRSRPSAAISSRSSGSSALGFTGFI